MTSLKKQYSANVKATGTGEIEAIVSLGTVDRDGDTIDPAGWQIDNYIAAGSPLLFAHDMRSLPIGKATAIWKSDKGLHARFKFANHPQAQAVRELMVDGMMRAFSVGYQSLKSRPNQHGGIHFEKQELLEISAVPVPAHPGAVAIARSKGITLVSPDDQDALYLDIVDEPTFEVDLAQVRALVDEKAVQVVRRRLGGDTIQLQHGGVTYDVDPHTLRDAIGNSIGAAVDSALQRHTGRLD